MSTKTTIRHGETKAEQRFHLYYDWLDEFDNQDKYCKFVHLQLDRCEFESFVQNGIPHIDVKIPIALARKIGLISKSKNPSKW